MPDPLGQDVNFKEVILKMKKFFILLFILPDVRSRITMSEKAFLWQENGSSGLILSIRELKINGIMIWPAETVRLPGSMAENGKEMR